MQLHIINTDDGSTTIYNRELNEIYHSRHGAINESLHVYINAGLGRVLHLKHINILEVGFGTGLNALLTFKHSSAHAISYNALEPYPLPDEIVGKLNYPSLLGNESLNEVFSMMHTCPWNEIFEINKDFYLQKQNKRLEDISLPENHYHLVYYDAFAPSVQPELWQPERFQMIYQSLKKGGLLVTYSSMGSVRRKLQEVGFKVERIPGPIGKREMIRAHK